MSKQDAEEAAVYKAVAERVYKDVASQLKDMLPDRVLAVVATGILSELVDANCETNTIASARMTINPGLEYIMHGMAYGLAIAARNTALAGLLMEAMAQSALYHVVDEAIHVADEAYEIHMREQ